MGRKKRRYEQKKKKYEQKKKTVKQKLASETPEERELRLQYLKEYRKRRREAETAKQLDEIAKQFDENADQLSKRQARLLRNREFVKQFLHRKEESKIAEERDCLSLLREKQKHIMELVKMVEKEVQTNKLRLWCLQQKKEAQRQAGILMNVAEEIPSIVNDPVNDHSYSNPEPIVKKTEILFSPEGIITESLTSNKRSVGIQNNFNAENFLFICGSEKMKYPLKGRRIVDVEHFFNTMQRVNQHSKFGCNLNDIVITSERKRGICTSYVLNCKICNFQEIIYSEDVSKSGDLNSDIIEGMLSLNCDFDGINELLAKLCLPTLSADFFDKELDKISLDLKMKEPQITDQRSYSILAFAKKRIPRKIKEIAMESSSFSVNVDEMSLDKKVTVGHITTKESAASPLVFVKTCDLSKIFKDTSALKTQDTSFSVNKNFIDPVVEESRITTNESSKPFLMHANSSLAKKSKSAKKSNSSKNFRKRSLKPQNPSSPVRDKISLEPKVSKIASNQCSNFPIVYSKKSKPIETFEKILKPNLKASTSSKKAKKKHSKELEKNVQRKSQSIPVNISAVTSKSKNLLENNGLLLIEDHFEIKEETIKDDFEHLLSEETMTPPPYRDELAVCQKQVTFNVTKIKKEINSDLDDEKFNSLETNEMKTPNKENDTEYVDQLQQRVIGGKNKNFVENDGLLLVADRFKIKEENVEDDSEFQISEHIDDNEII